MDDAALQESLRRIKYRQYLILGLLGIPYLYVFADRIGVARAGLLYVLAGALTFGVITVRRRRTRNRVRE